MTSLKKTKTKIFFHCRLEDLPTVESLEGLNTSPV